MIILITIDIYLEVLLEKALGLTDIEEFESEQIVPDVIDVVPKSILNVTYENDVEVNLGNLLTPTQVQKVPNITWDADPDKFYGLTMTDLDVPTRKEPKNRGKFL